jgi:two-component system, NarL family, response regulator NreC
MGLGKCERGLAYSWTSNGLDVVAAGEAEGAAGSGAVCAQAVGALKSGARGYLLKDSAESDLIQAIRAVSSGKAFFSPAVSKVLADDYVRQLQRKSVEDPYDLLTARERELLQLVAELKSTKDIANMLNLSPYTVDTHRANLMQKLNMHSIPELILYAMRKGVIT